MEGAAIVLNIAFSFSPATAPSKPLFDKIPNAALRSSNEIPTSEANPATGANAAPKDSTPDADILEFLAKISDTFDASPASIL